MPLQIFIAAVAILVLSTVRAYAITIDEFQTAQSLSLVTPLDAVKSSTLNDAFSYGGIRTLEAQRISSATGLTVKSGQGSFTVSQDAFVQGHASIAWSLDPSKFSSAVISSGIDFKSDGSTKFIIGVRSFDFAFAHSVTIRITVFDARDTTFQSASSSEIKLSNAFPPNGSNPFSGPVLEFPFSQFTQVGGANNVASFNHLGTIRLSIISESTDTDLSLAPFYTDGCRALPDVDGASRDLCGVCGGHNSSCKDCAGVPLGNLTLDRCNECGGNGQSCISCMESDQTPLLAALDGGAKKQERIIKLLLAYLTRGPRGQRFKKYSAKLLPVVHMLQIRNWTISWTLPRTTRKCSTGKQFCVETSLTPLLTEYRSHAKELLGHHNDVAKEILRLIRRPPLKIATLIRQGRERYQLNVGLTKSVPIEQFACS